MQLTAEDLKLQYRGIILNKIVDRTYPSPWKAKYNNMLKKERKELLKRLDRLCNG